MLLPLVALLFSVQGLLCAEVRLDLLEPSDAQQVIEQQDQSLDYAPKIESNVPAVRFLGNEPHHVLEDIYLARQYHGQDGLGGYLYGYNIPDIAKTEKKKPSGDLRGAYNYIAGNGKEIKVEYWDDGTGFHQIDNVPKVLPQQIDDSPEVKAAKEKFLARWHEEAERNTHPIANPYDSEGQYASGPLSPQVQYQQQHQQPGQYQQPAQNQPTVQYQQQSSQQYQPAQYQPTVQYQQQSSQQYQPTYGQQYQQATSPNQVDYSGQYSENRDVFSQPKQQNKEEEEDTTGPPRGFFYSFDYPVGKIVNKEGLVKSEGDVRDVYDSNKASFQAQLRDGRQAAGTAQAGYVYVKN